MDEEMLFGLSEDEYGSPDEGQEPETDEALQEEGEPEEEQEEQEEQLILGKFKSVDDLAKAYKNLEKKLGKDAQERKALQDEMSQIRQLLMSQQAPQTKQPEEEDMNGDDFLTLLAEKGPKAIDERTSRLINNMLQKQLEPINEFITQQYYNQQVQQTASKYKDFYDYKDDITEILSSNEYNWLVNQKNGIEVAYHLAKSMRSPEKIAAVAEEAEEEGKKSVLAKQAARIPASSGSKKTAPTKKAPEDLIREAVFGGAGSKGIFDN